MLVINCPMFETVNLPVKAYILWDLETESELAKKPGAD